MGYITKIVDYFKKNPTVGLAILALFQAVIHSSQEETNLKIEENESDT